MVLAEREGRRENDRESLIRGRMGHCEEEEALHRGYINLLCIFLLLLLITATSFLEE